MMFTSTPESTQAVCVIVGASHSGVNCAFEFASNLLIDEFSQETKYYADGYLKPITANQPINFAINNVTKSEFGEAFLRLSMGRTHGLSLQPIVTVNGTAVTVPENLSGDNQLRRNQFFGAVDIPIPYNVLAENNNVSITFEDGGGHVSTATLSVFNFSHELRKTDTTIQVPQIAVQKNNLEVTEFAKGSGEQKVMMFTLNADEDGAQLYSLTIQASGEVDVATDVTNVRLYRINDENTDSPVLIESAQFSQQNSSLLLSFDSPLVLPKGENQFHVTYEF